jgi:hypothetical protein
MLLHLRLRFFDLGFVYQQRNSGFLIVELTIHWSSNHTWSSVPCCLVLLLFRVWSVLELSRSVWWIWDFLTWAGLTAELYWPDRCRGLLWKFSNFAMLLQQGPVWSVLLTSLTSASQCARVASSAAFSSWCRWLLVPRTSSTPMATWSWPTWVVESEMCVEDVFV